MGRPDHGLIGQRSGEITMYISGTGSGKSTIVREIASTTWPQAARSA